MPSPAVLPTFAAGSYHVLPGVHLQLAVSSMHCRHPTGATSALLEVMAVVVSVCRLANGK